MIRLVTFEGIRLSLTIVTNDMLFGNKLDNAVEISN